MRLVLHSTLASWIRAVSCLGCLGAAVTASPAAAQDSAPASAIEASIDPGDAGGDDASEEAEPPPGDRAEEDDAWKRAPSLRRGGFMLGLALGGGIGSSAGFPNDAKKIGREDYYTETSVGPAASARLFLGGGLIDWLTFGVGLDMNQVVAESTSSSSTVIFLHVDAFPLWWMGGFGEDTGVFMDAGTGSALTTPDDDPDTRLIDGGAVSHISTGVFWEGLRAWKLSMGPFVGLSYSWSESVRRPMGLVGFRTTMYTKP